MFPDDDHELTGWNGIERALGNRNYTIFAGHVHNYARFVRNGRDYITLATTGGSSKLRGKSEGEFDQIVWVTMKDSEPVIANINHGKAINETCDPIAETIFPLHSSKKSRLCHNEAGRAGGVRVFGMAFP